MPTHADKPKPAPQRRKPAVAKPRPPTNPLLGLQRLAGNRAITAMVQQGMHQAQGMQQTVDQTVDQTIDQTVQRSPVNATSHETLYNTENAAGAAVAGAYGAGPTPRNNLTPGSPSSYDISRSPDGQGVIVSLKIRFLQQSRNGVAPPNPNPTNLPALGALTGAASEIPTDDPDGRRAWATTTAAAAAQVWTDQRVKFNSTDHGADPSAPADTPVHLPVTFRSEAVFGLNDPANHQIIVHPVSTVPGTPGQPIDAGNYYHQASATDPAQRAANYPQDDARIYAHEYGHLIGIPDEYSQSNEQMNALLHQAAPATAASAQAALDRAALERMTLASLAQPMYSALQSALPGVSASLTAAKPLVTQKLAQAARAGVTDDAVRTELQNELVAGAEPGLAPQVPGVVSFESTRNFSNLTTADTAVEGAFDVNAVWGTIQDAYWQALQAPHDETIANFDSVRIDVSSGVRNSTASGPLQAPAGAVAAGSVGPGAPAVGLPPVAPADTLIGQLNALPATWSAAGSQLQSGVTPAAFSTAMTAGLRSAAGAAAVADAAATLAASLGVGTGPAAKTSQTGPLYRRAYTLLNNAASGAARQVVNDMLLATMRPALVANVDSMRATIATEVARVLATPPAGLAAAGPADANMAAIVASMKTRLDADKATNAATARIDPTSGGGTAAAQNVTYTAEGLMGSSSTATVRVDQFTPMLAAFNANVRVAPREDPFTASVGT